MVPSKVPHLSSAHSLKANLLHRHSNLLPALLLVIPVPQLRLTKDLPSHGQLVRGLLKARDLLLVKALLSGAREVHLKLRGNSLCPSSSRNRQQEALARNLQQANPSRRGLPSLLDSSHRVGRSNRGLLASKVDLEHPPPSSPDLLLKARGAQEDDPRCSKSLSPHRSLVRTTRLRAVLLN